jgi:hypothetical protein
MMSDAYSSTNCAKLRIREQMPCIAPLGAKYW